MGYRLEGGSSRTRKQIAGSTAVGFQHGRQQLPLSPRLDTFVGRPGDRAGGQDRTSMMHSTVSGTRTMPSRGRGRKTEGCLSVDGAWPPDLAADCSWSRSTTAWASGPPQPPRSMRRYASESCSARQTTPRWKSARTLARASVLGTSALPFRPGSMDTERNRCPGCSTLTGSTTPSSGRSCWPPAR